MDKKVCNFLYTVMCFFSSNRRFDTTSNIIFFIVCIIMLFFISPLKGDVLKDLDKQKPVGEVLNIYHVWNKLSVAIAGKGKENNEIKKIGTHIFSFGEDACFVTLAKHISPKAIALGVADGVGGWRKKGIDPGDFSRALVGHMQNATAIDPQQIIQEGYDCLLGEKKVTAGSSTACVARGFARNFSNDYLA